MALFSAAILLLAFAYNCNGAQVDVQSTLVGTWKNELGSIMLICPKTATSASTSFYGLYCSKVGQAVHYYNHIGLYDNQGTDNGGTLGWTVEWINEDGGDSKSVTTWSGRRFTDGSKLKIDTTWLLSTKDNTYTSKDVFERIDATPNMIECQHSLSKLEAEINNPCTSTTTTM